MNIRYILITILFILCLIIGGYIFWQNKKQLKELFIDKSSDAYEDSITSIFQTYVFRDPLKSEIRKYRKLMKTPNDTSDAILELKKTKEYQNIANSSKKSNSGVLAPNIPLQLDEYDIVDKRVNDMDMEKKTKVYRKVIAIYDQILARMPTMSELNYYTARIVIDKDLDEDQLRKVLESSREFKILKRNQSNEVFAELPLNATNAQLEYEVEEIYRNVMGFESSDKTFEEDYEKPLDYRNDVDLTDEMMNFLKQKYVEYELNRERLRSLIIMIHKLDKQNVNVKKIIDYKEPQKTKKDKNDKKDERKKDWISKRSKEIKQKFGEKIGTEEVKGTKEDSSVTNFEIEGFDDGTTTQNEDTDEEDGNDDKENENNDYDEYMKKIRQRREELVKDRFKDIKKVRNSLEDEKSDKLKELEKSFELWSDKQNKKVREIYENENDDAIVNEKKQEFEKNKKDILKADNGEVIERIMKSSSFVDGNLSPFEKNNDSFARIYEQKKKMKRRNKERKNNKKQEKQKSDEKEIFRKKAKDNAKLCSDYDIPELDYERKQPEPYNICSVDPFHIIHNKTREVYDKRRNGLAYIQNERNQSELKNVCGRKYLNADDNMKLFPEYSWSVPQKRPPVCIPEKKNDYQPLMAQTALIGTLLDET